MSKSLSSELAPNRNISGVSQWSPLSEMYMQQRTLRLADGPDEVHHNVVARNEVNRYNQTGA